MTEQFSDVTFYSYLQGPSWPWTDGALTEFKAEFASVNLLVENETRALRLLGRLKNLALALLPSLHRTILSWRIPGAAKELKKYYDRHPDSLVYCNYVDGLTQLNGLGKQRQYVVDTYDVKFAHYMKLKRTRPTDLKVLRKFRSEMACLLGAKGVVAISPSEESFFRMVLGSTPVYFVPLTPDPVVHNELQHEFEYDLVFVGSSVALNVEGLCGFIEENYAWLSEYKLAVCGLVCTDERVQRLSAARPNVILLGAVPNLDEVMSVCRFSISPVDGTGLKIKVVDSLARGVPVFASRQSLDGLVPGYQGCVFPLEASLMQRLLSDDTALSEARSEAISYYEVFRNSGDIERFMVDIA